MRKIFREKWNPHFMCSALDGSPTVYDTTKQIGVNTP